MIWKLDITICKFKMKIYQFEIRIWRYEMNIIEFETNFCKFEMKVCKFEMKVWILTLNTRHSHTTALENLRKFLSPLFEKFSDFTTHSLNDGSVSNPVLKIADPELNGRHAGWKNPATN